MSVAYVRDGSPLCKNQISDESHSNKKDLDQKDPCGILFLRI